MVQPSYIISNGVNSTTGALTQVLPIPAGTLVGDICYLFAEIDSGTAPTYTPPAGWSVLLASTTAQNMGVAGFWKRMTAADITTGSISVTSSNGYGNLTGHWYRDCSDPAVIGTLGTRGGVSSNAVTAPSLTTLVNAATVLTFTGDRSTASTAGEQGPPTFSASTYRGGIEGVMTLSAGVGISTCYVGDRVIATAGASGIDTATYPDTATNAWGFQVAVVGQQTQAMRVYDGASTSARLYVTIDSTGGAGSVKPVLGLSKT
jgi:hypothetical protein